MLSNLSSATTTATTTATSSATTSTATTATTTSPTNTNGVTLESLSAWQQLKHLSPIWQKRHTLDLFKADAEREKKFSFTDSELNTGELSPSTAPSSKALAADKLHLNLSKQRLDQNVLETLVALAEQTGLSKKIQQLFAGEAVNFTEQRPALHITSRFSTPNLNTAHANAEATLAKMDAFTEQFYAGKILGASGQPLKTVVSIGIGGSDLGPRLLTEALMAGKRPLVPIRFVANIDPDDLDESLLDINAEETLFIISSKSFTTPETLSNAKRARLWLQQALGKQYNDSALAAHLVGVSNNLSAAEAFGIAPERLFELPQSVGGRFSVWSAVGLPAMLAVGPQRFREFLAGGQEMDTHFSTASFSENLPVIMALVALWNSQFLNIETLAVLPYAHALRNLPSYLQQLEMESNGKSVRYDGQSVTAHTAQFIWGAAGTNGQHAFHQLFYQGTRRCALDFIVASGAHNQASTTALTTGINASDSLSQSATSLNNLATASSATATIVSEHQNAQHALWINAQAQAQVLMAGQSTEKSLALLRAQGIDENEALRLAPHRSAPGNLPISMLSFAKLTPTILGKLIALYEHKTFVLGCLWGINCFDQFGVELGKEMARQSEIEMQRK